MARLLLNDPSPAYKYSMHHASAPDNTKLDYQLCSRVRLSTPLVYGQWFLIFILSFHLNIFSL
jgi:hypothetical protein